MPACSPQRKSEAYPRILLADVIADAATGPASPFSWQEHPDGARADAVSERRHEAGHLAVERDAERFFVGVDVKVREADGVEVARLLKPPEQRPQRQPNEPEAAGVVGGIEAEFPIADARPPAEVEAGD